MQYFVRLFAIACGSFVVCGALHLGAGCSRPTTVFTSPIDDANITIDAYTKESTGASFCARRCSQKSKITETLQAMGINITFAVITFSGIPDVETIEESIRFLCNKRIPMQLVFKKPKVSQDELEMLKGFLQSGVQQFFYLKGSFRKDNMQVDNDKLVVILNGTKL